MCFLIVIFTYNKLQQFSLYEKMAEDLSSASQNGNFNGCERLLASGASANEAVIAFLCFRFCYINSLISLYVLIGLGWFFTFALRMFCWKCRYCSFASCFRLGHNFLSDWLFPHRNSSGFLFFFNNYVVL